MTTETDGTGRVQEKYSVGKNKGVILRCSTPTKEQMDKRYRAGEGAKEDTEGFVIRLAFIEHHYVP